MCIIIYWTIREDLNCKDLTPLLCWLSWGYILQFYYILLYIHMYQLSSVTQSCPTLCDSMNDSMPGLPAHHQLPEFIQTHVHWVSDAIQPSHPLPRFSSHLQSFPASRSFQMSQVFASVGQSIGVSASASVLPMNIWDWFPLNRDNSISNRTAHSSRFCLPNSFLCLEVFSL